VLHHHPMMSPDVCDHRGVVSLSYCEPVVYDWQDQFHIESAFFDD
jgi:hypothetical protein